MHRLALLLLSAIIFSGDIFSQSNIVDPKSAVNQTAPLPPDLANLGQYAMSPPNLSNGLPQQSIPLFEIKENGLKFPVELFYNYGGFRVKEEATSIGLGWGITEALIIREVKHLPDEHPGLAKKFEDFGDNFEDELGPGSVDNQYSYTGSQVTYQGDQGLHNLTQNRLYYKYYDAQPDIYILNCAGYSAKFLWLNNQAVKIDQNDLVISRESTSGSDFKFTVLTHDGIKFTFLPMDHMEISGGNNTTALLCNGSQQVTYSEHDYTVGWRLSEMKSMLTGQVISFKHRVNYSIQEKTVDQSSFFTLIAPLQIDNNFLITSFRTDDSYNKTVTSTYFLDEIESENFKVTFVNDSRLDNDQYRIRQINVYSKTNLQLPVKSINFMQGYFGNSSSPDNCWLKLAAVNMKGAGENRTFSFSYVGENITAVFPKSSLSIDHWGYYNGYANASLVPYSNEIDFRIRNNSINSNVGLTAPFGNRTPEFSQASMFALQKVIYPTTGFTTFTYESSLGKGIRVRAQADNDGEKELSRYYEYHSSGAFPAIYSVNEFYSYQNCGTNVIGNVSQVPPDLPVNTISYTYSSTPDASSDIVDSRQSFYDEVTEYIGTVDGKGGKSVYNFAQINAIGKEVFLTEKSDYEFGNNTAIAWEKYDYGIPSTRDIKYWSIPELYNQLVPSAPCHADASEQVVCAPTDPVNGYILQNPTGSTKSTFAYWKHLDAISSLNQGVVTTKRFYYQQLNGISGIPKHTQPVKIAETRSNGESKTIYNYYAGDVDPDDLTTILGVGEMWDNTNENFLNCITPVLKTKVFVGNKLIAKESNHFVFERASRLLLRADYESLPKGVEKGKVKYQFTYNSKAQLIDVQKQNDLHQSFIWGYNNSYPIAQATNARSNEIFHEGFEEGVIWPNVVSGWPDMVVDKSKVHSGEYSGKISNSSNSELYYHSPHWLQISLTASKQYKYSGWFFSDGPEVEMFLFMKKAGETGYLTYVDNVSTTTTGKWVYIEKEFAVPADVVELNIRVDNNGGGTIWFDDLRLHPSDAQMTTYTYAPLIGLTSQTDIANRTNYYEYDEFGRLYLIRDHDKNILKKVCYNYSGQQNTCAIFYNERQSQIFTKVCASGVGSQVEYLVPANIYAAGTQSEANILALNDIAVNGQNYANENGVCTAPPSPVFITVNGLNYKTTSYYVQFVNVATGQATTMYLPAGGNGSVSILSGDYNINMSPAGPSITATFRVNGYSTYGTSASFSNVNIANGSQVVIGF